MSSHRVPFAGIRFGFQRAAVPVQLKGADLRFGQRVAGEPAVVRRSGSAAGVHRLVGVGFERRGARRSRRPGRRRSDTACCLRAARRVRSSCRRIRSSARDARRRPSRTRPGRPRRCALRWRRICWRSRAIRRRRRPTRPAGIVGPLPCGDQQSAVGFPELDVADLPEADRQRDFRRSSGRLGGRGCSSRQLAAPRFFALAGTGAGANANATRQGQRGDRQAGVTGRAGHRATDSPLPAAPSGRVALGGAPGGADSSVGRTRRCSRAASAAPGALNVMLDAGREPPVLARRVRRRTWSRLSTSVTSSPPADARELAGGGHRAGRDVARTGACAARRERPRRLARERGGGLDAHRAAGSRAQRTGAGNRDVEQHAPVGARERAHTQPPCWFGARRGRRRDVLRLSPARRTLRGRRGTRRCRRRAPRTACRRAACCRRRRRG